MQKLYMCKSKVEHNGCSNLTFFWIVNHREPLRCCDGLTKTPGDPYQEENIQELFDEDELSRFREYLHRSHPETKVIATEAEIPTNCIAIDGFGYGGGDHLYMLYREDGYDLPFEVGGYYEMSEHWEGRCGCAASQKFKPARPAGHI